MEIVNVVTVDALLFDFCKRAALDENADPQKVYEFVMKIIADVEQDNQVRGALDD